MWLRRVKPNLNFETDPWKSFSCPLAHPGSSPTRSELALPHSFDTHFAAPACFVFWRVPCPSTLTVTCCGWHRHLRGNSCDDCQVSTADKRRFLRNLVAALHSGWRPLTHCRTVAKGGWIDRVFIKLVLSPRPGHEWMRCAPSAQLERNRPVLTELGCSVPHRDCVTPGGSFRDFECMRHPLYFPGAKYSLPFKKTRSQLIEFAGTQVCCCPRPKRNALVMSATVNRVANRPETAICWQRRGQFYLLAQ